MRDTMGLFQRGFAKLVGVSVKTLQNWEQGKAAAGRAYATP
jgi:DNA-binding transcriptional regulator YiaG